MNYEKIEMENRYLNLGAKVLAVFKSTGTIKTVPGMIREELDLQAVYALSYRPEEERLKMSGHAFDPSLAARDVELLEKFTGKLNIDLKKNSVPKEFLTTQTESRIIRFKSLLENAFLSSEKRNRILEINRGETYVGLLKNLENERCGFLILVNKAGRIFSGDEKAGLNRLVETVSDGISNCNLIYNDELTGLWNLKFFKKIIKKKISEENFSIISVEISNLEKIMSSKGEAVGKYYILRVCERLKQRLSPYPVSILFKKSHSVFFCYIKDLSKKEAEYFSKEVLLNLQGVEKADGHLINFKLSIGICFSQDADNVNDLIMNGNRAVEKARNTVKSTNYFKLRYAFYDETLKREVERENDLENALKNSISRGEDVYVYYQPKVRTDGRLAGYEALARWRDPFSHEVVSMGQYMPQISRLGLSDRLFRVIFKQVCRDVPRLNREISINMDAEQFTDIDIVNDIRDILASFEDSGLKGMLKLEILETDMIEDNDFSILRGLREIGIKTSMDDFGMGYSNLKRMVTLIKKGLIDELKIDKELIRDLGNDTRFFTTVINIGYKFQLSIVVEGIENVEQFKIIKRNFPQAIIQGFLFSKPKPLDEISDNDEEEYKDIVRSIQ